MTSTSTSPTWEHDPTLVDVRLAHVAVTTGDLDRMCRFYVDVVGLQLRSLAAPVAAPYARVAAFGSDAHDRLVVFEVPGYLPSERARRPAPVFEHLALCFPDPMALTALEARLRMAGHLAGEPTYHHGRRTLSFADPDGTEIVAAPRPPHPLSPTQDTTRSTSCTPTPTPPPPSPSPDASATGAGWACSSHRPWRW